MPKRSGQLRQTETLQLYSLLAPVLILIAVFCYAPLYGIVIAFQDYVPGSAFIGENVKWVGLANFERFVQGEYFWRLMKNTLVLSGLNLAFGFTMPILFALLLDQIHVLKLRKIIQTASYMPYFISTVVVAGMVISFIDVQGMITNLLTVLGMPAKNYRVEPSAFPTIYTVTNIWKGFGFGSILYVSTINSIDPGLYESAKMDGANRWKQVLHVTLPGLRQIIAINLIMTIGGILNTNSELILLLYSSAVYDVADVIGTYTYRLGITGGQYSLTTAAGLFMSAIGFALTYAANKVSGRLTGYSLW
jgi:putative aldouronate transport system permease protein